MKLYSYQQDAIDKLTSGSVLCGGVGSGKSLTSLGYFFQKECPLMGKGEKKLLIITTARKRDGKEWDQEFEKFGDEFEKNKVSVTVDSWNNIKKYIELRGAFIIFDEQRLVGNGAWVKTFFKLARSNRWILLTATPGDTWMDYVPVFVANGFYRNPTHFINSHVVFSRFTTYPKVDRFINEGVLYKYKQNILVNMEYQRNITRNYIYKTADYDAKLYKWSLDNRWNPYKNEPEMNAGGMCYTLRRISNSSMDHVEELRKLVLDNKRCIIFYNFDYELELIRRVLDEEKIIYAEWNGHKHEEVPGSEKWCYVVQYTAGAEAWNCTETNTIIFYSLNYSYKIMTQAAGRIDRVNSPFDELNYYYIVSESSIDKAIRSALKKKKNFNEKSFIR